MCQYKPRYFHFRELTSTLDEARRATDSKYLYVHGDILSADVQSAGRGQRGHTWHAAPRQNLLVAQVWEPGFLPVARQFTLTEIVALALVDLFRMYGLDARIKWTNDIYIGDRKIVGILIENNMSRGRIARCVTGIGVNVNQTDFDPSLPNPTSMRLELGREVDREEVLMRLGDLLSRRFKELESGVDLSGEYHAHLYRLDEPSPYRYPDGAEFQATLRGVRATGELVLEMSDGTMREFLFGEVFYSVSSPSKNSFGEMS